MDELFLYAPCVFLVGDDYQIMFNTRVKGMGEVLVGDTVYRDEAFGLMRWADTIHRVTVPQRALDAARRYTLRFAPLEERIPYFTTMPAWVERTFDFRPVDTAGDIRLYHLADVHSRPDQPCDAARYWGAEANDLLVFNGDIADRNDCMENLLTLYRVNDRVNGGHKPILFVRGNHDTRGQLAHRIADYIGTTEGATYFSFRTGALWGVALDCGEDKLDGHIEYGGTVDFAAYRRRETAFLERLAREKPFEAPGIRHRIAVCHIPFTLRQPDPFDIENELYAHWTALLNEMGIELLLCGHLHRAFVVRPGDDQDRRGQRFPMVVGAALDKEKNFTGCAITLGKAMNEVRFTDRACRVLAEHALPR